jgi:hypothetical protein
MDKDTGEGFMPKTQGFPFARDNFVLKCKSEYCLWYARGQCSVPSMVSISADGRCEFRQIGG